MSRYEGKVALVTGASSGIGAATARLLAENGARVFTAQRRIAGFEDFSADLSDPAALQALMARKVLSDRPAPMARKDPRDRPAPQDPRPPKRARWPSILRPDGATWPLPMIWCKCVHSVWKCWITMDPCPCTMPYEKDSWKWRVSWWIGTLKA